MPSSPEALAVEPADYARWEPTEVAGPPHEHRPARTRSSRTPFDRLFPTVTSTQAPEPFVVSARSGIPDALLAEARQEAQSAGYAQGFANGMAEARAHALAEATAEQARAERLAQQAAAAVERAVGALVAASDELARRTALTLADVEDLVVATAFDIAEAVLGASTRHDPQRGATAVARALALVPDGAGELCIRVHPDDHEVVRALPATAGVRIVADPALAPGDAIATSDAVTVDARLAAGLNRVREVLGR